MNINYSEENTKQELNTLAELDQWNKDNPDDPPLISIKLIREAQAKGLIPIPSSEFPKAKTGILDIGL